MEFSTRFVALGDSFTEGVGDDDGTLPNAVRGWADRVAQELARVDSGLGYANLAIRGRKLGQIMAEQVEAAVALAPTLVTLYAGANDILRPSVDIDALMLKYDDGVGRLRASGATVVLFSGFDAKGSKVFGTMRGRTAIYNELVRDIADRHGALIADFWRFSEYYDWRMWAQDRIHLSTAGHINMAKRVLALLEHESDLQVPDIEPAPELSRRQALRANARWVRQYVGPWVGRRLRGVSSGDSLNPRWPQLHAPGATDGATDWS
ncbi:SGNH/GDSL hydrolase family protein [Paenarthrobacter sp. Z7-10]|uniref:SGNH/GDSL hydrolase family protein n=1 Tax=Paenarthrobacter sp. Z7-10 TaxID=2787635 RepID=UPI0022A97F80|nr:SGNH/GDSL hydrolase family protein [Paenarthrobacter sp. Z7-10]MCZ2403135.1 SGNH/GDSL hydrolase family protein [Paenarthrobacter sp. Z7-10]